VDIYWDSNAPVEGFDNFEEFEKLYHDDVKSGGVRFKFQGTVSEAKALPINTYQSHVFIGISKGDGKVRMVHQINREKYEEEDPEVDVIG